MITINSKSITFIIILQIECKMSKHVNKMNEGDDARPKLPEKEKKQKLH